MIMELERVLEMLLERQSRSQPPSSWDRERERADFELLTVASSPAQWLRTRRPPGCLSAQNNQRWHSPAESAKHLPVFHVFAITT